MEEIIRKPTIACLFCNYCGKGYKTRSHLEKHVLLCEITYRSNNKKKILIYEDDDESIPSQKRLYQMLMELGEKYFRLEEKVNEMNKWVSKKKKKINVLEWLNINVKPEITFDKFYEKILVDQTDIDYLFNNSCIDTFDNIFSKTIYTISESYYPIITFEQRSGLFYIYDKINDKEDFLWYELKREKFIIFLNKIHKKLFKELVEWKKNNIQKMKNDDKYAIEYDKTMVKLMGTEFNKDNMLNKIKTLMYNKMKTDMKSMVEYEFEFE
jgi:hypothetical protein